MHHPCNHVPKLHPRVRNSGPGTTEEKMSKGKEKVNPDNVNNRGAKGRRVGFLNYQPLGKSRRALRVEIQKISWVWLNKGVEWNILFGTAIDAIWTIRNKLVFGNMLEALPSLISAIQARSQCTVKAFHQSCSSVIHYANTCVPQIRWFPADVHWIKLNTDGAFLVLRELLLVVESS
ncbi:unnamed protein product [Lupinus luteus]|uniref:Uncharacterized protein n=1 Tax=Lupinus luteus TaxID=3873 RepID=A0AAV1WG04_LUPLU